MIKHHLGPPLSAWIIYMQVSVFSSVLIKGFTVVWSLPMHRDRRDMIIDYTNNTMI